MKVQGKIRTFLDDESKAIYPLTTMDAVIVEGSKTLKQKFKDMRSGLETSSTYYLIELERWGIVEGAQGKPPYTAAQWSIAYNNLLGFNKALAWANARGLTHVVVPKGRYAFTYTNLEGGAEVWQMKSISIRLYDNQTLDLNGSVFEVMFDSLNKNPYDKSPETTPPWRLAGTLIRMEHVKNAHLINGTLFGDIPNRSFTDGGSGFNSERGQEQTYGVMIDKSSHCSVENIDSSMFMGDGICLGAMPYRGEYESWSILGGLGNACAPGYMGSDGIVVEQAGAYISPEYPVDPTKFGTFLQMRSGGGYTRIPSITHKHFEYIFLDVNKALISKRNAVYLENVPIPYNARYVRVQFVNEAVGLASLTTINYDLTKPQNNNIRISNCNVHDNHRGGISGGADFTHIEHCQLFRNGSDSGLGIPLFPDTTRYALNFEDSYANFLTIENCEIGDSFNGLLLGVYHARVTGCYIHSTSGIVVYNNASTFIDNNVFYNAGISLMGTSAVQERSIYVSNNTIYAQQFGISTSTHPTTRVFFDTNTIFMNTGSFDGNVHMSNNYIRGYNGSAFHASHNGPTFNDCANFVGNVIEDFGGGFYRCTYVCTNQSQFNMRSNTFINCSFNSFALSNHNQFVDSKLINCKYSNPPKDKAIDSSISFINCLLINFRMTLGGTYVNDSTTTNVTIKGIFKNCEITMNDNHNEAFMLDIGDNVNSKRNYVFELIDSNVSFENISKNLDLIDGIGQPADITLQNVELYIRGGSLKLADSTKFTLMRYYNKARAFFEDVKYTGADSVITGVNVVNKAVIHKGTVPPIRVDERVIWIHSTNNKTYIWDKTNLVWVDNTGMPYSAKGTRYNVGNTKASTSPLNDGFIGWVCVTAGFESDVAWTASTTQTVNKIVYVDTRVYICTLAGTSGTTAPTHTTGTAADGTATWEYLGPRAVLYPYGMISG